MVFISDNRAEKLEKLAEQPEPLGRTPAGHHIGSATWATTEAVWEVSGSGSPWSSRMMISVCGACSKTWATVNSTAGAGSLTRGASRSGRSVAAGSDSLAAGSASSPGSAVGSSGASGGKGVATGRSGSGATSVCSAVGVNNSTCSGTAFMLARIRPSWRKRTTVQIVNRFDVFIVSSLLLLSGSDKRARAGNTKHTRQKISCRETV